MLNVRDLHKSIEEKLKLSVELKALRKTWENTLREEFPTTIPIQFDVSDMLRVAARLIGLNRDPRIPFQIDPGMSERYAFESRIIWERKRYLNRELTRQFRTFNDFPGNISLESVTQFQFQLGILIVLSFPTLMTNLRRTSKKKRGEPSLYLDIQPLLTPELVIVRINFCNGFGSIKDGLTDSHIYNRILAIQKDDVTSTGISQYRKTFCWRSYLEINFKIH